MIKKNFFLALRNWVQLWFNVLIFRSTLYTKTWDSFNLLIFPRTCFFELFQLYLPKQGIWPRYQKSPGNMTLKASRIWLQDLHKTGETETPLLEGENKTLHTPGLKGKEEWPYKRLSETYLWVFEGLLQRCVLPLAHHRHRGSGSSSPGRCVQVALEVTNSTIWEPVDSRTRSPQAKQITGRNTATPIRIKYPGRER